MAKKHSDSIATNSYTRNLKSIGVSTIMLWIVEQ